MAGRNAIGIVSEQLVRICKHATFALATSNIAPRAPEISLVRACAAALNIEHESTRVLFCINANSFRG